MSVRVAVPSTVVVCFSLFVFGCADRVSDPIEPSIRASNLQSKIPRLGTEGSIDGLFLKIAERVPAFAGMFINAAGTPTILLTDLRQRGAAADAVRDVMSTRTPALDLAQFESAEALHGFRELHDIKARLMTIVARRGAKGFGIHPSSNQIHIDSPSPETDALVASDLLAAGVPLTAIAFRRWELTNVVQLTDWFTGLMPASVGVIRRDVYGNGHTCTLGAHAIRETDTLFIIASHCTEQEFAYDGGQILQGANDLGARIGYEAYDRDWHTDPMTCAGAAYCRWSDAALIRWASYYPARRPDFGWIGTTTVRGQYGNITYSGMSNDQQIISQWTTQPLQNEVVDRVGSSSGWNIHNIQSDYGQVARLMIY